MSLNKGAVEGQTSTSRPIRTANSGWTFSVQPAALWSAGAAQLQAGLLYSVVYCVVALGL